MSKHEQRTWVGDRIITRLTWKQGRSYYVKPYSAGTFHIYSQVPRQKGSQEYEGALMASLDTGKWMYSVRKDSSSRVAVVRTSREAINRLRAATAAAKRGESLPAPPRKQAIKHPNPPRHTQVPDVEHRPVKSGPIKRQKAAQRQQLLPLPLHFFRE